MFIERYFHRHDALKRLQDNILGNGLEDFTAYLTNRGHTPKTINLYVRAVAHFGRWLGRRKIDPASIKEDTVSLFLHDHLPKCDCKPPGIRSLKEARPALKYLLHSLRIAGRVPFPPESNPTPINREVMNFEKYLRTTCGLADDTILYRTRYAREFLLAKFGNSLLKIAELTPSDIIDFVSERAKNYKPGSSKVLASSIRSFLRFQCFQGKCRQDLANAVPTIPIWKQSHIPKTISKEQLDNFLSSFDRSTPTGRRDYAMCLCLSELGLRTSEVAGLCLDDINWREGTLTVASTKTRRPITLPLPKRLGKAIVDYLCNGRPKSTDRHIFLRHVVPKGSAIGRRIVENAVQRACSRAPSGRYRISPHVFRHTLACRMHEKGATFKEIADVLGHQQIDTVSIYAKVNLRQLSEVPLPWPKEGSS